MNTVHPDYRTEFAARQAHYLNRLMEQPQEMARQLMELLGARTYRAIVVYPEAVPWEPQQRPHHMLREMARRGYLCFFCESFEGEYGWREVEPNLILLRGEAHLLPALRSEAPIVLCTWMIQLAWADLLPHKVLWYDLLDAPELFALYDEAMLARHRLTVRSADVVTYSARPLERYLENRAEAAYVPNAAFPEHFAAARGADLASVPDDLAPIVAGGAPVVGYFGALESWFDAELLDEVARRRPEWQFVLIGENRLPGLRPARPNVHFLGPKAYGQLPGYGCFFHAGIIPFIVNETTRCISPVKFFEYAALGLPVVSAPLPEIVPHRSDWVLLASSADEWEEAIERALQPETQRLAGEQGPPFALRNRWTDRLALVRRQFEARPGAWRAFAGDRPTGKVAVMTATFLDYEGERFYSGGAERYLLDLSRVCRQLGLDFAIYQYGNYAWRRRVRDVDVISLSRGGQHARSYSVPAIRMFCRLFREQTDGRASLAIYSAHFNAWPHGAGTPSIGIIHGVAWDSPDARLRDGADFWGRNRRFIEGARLCDTIVSVDTNSANWFQTIDFELGRNVRVVPNYVEIEHFTPRDGYLHPRERLVILFPRRLYRPRGLYLALDVVDRILERYPHVDFHFVGNGEPADTEHVERKRLKWPDRIRRYALPLEEMAQAYREADIALIPSLHSEGTSLSCLEAMACGNAVIATRIGGLTDLVIHDYNGLLIEPNAEALHDAIRELLDRPEKLAALKRRAVEVATVFSKRRWERNWRTIVEAALQRGGRDAGRKRTLDRGQLVEIYLPAPPPQNGRFGEVVTALLERGDTVYLRIRNFAHKQAYSFGRLQWMNWTESAFADPDWVLAHRSVREEVPRRVDAVWNEGGEWEWTSSSRPLSIAPAPRSSSASSTPAEGR